MEPLTIRLNDQNYTKTCSLCGQHTVPACGPRLFLEERGEPVCRECGKRHAPNLVALLDLAHVAERVGRKSRHILTPPMEALLDLARAAENYIGATPRLKRSA
jgi:transposase